MKAQPKNLTTSLMIVVGLGCIVVTWWKNDQEKTNARMATVQQDAVEAAYANAKTFLESGSQQEITLAVGPRK
jgi:uncharacterized protein HemX